jgi:hypothetical protein
MDFVPSPQCRFRNRRPLRFEWRFGAGERAVLPVKWRPDCCMLGSDRFPPFFAAGQQRSNQAPLEVQRNKLGDRVGKAPRAATI